jgi:hypothetical protein
MVRQNLFFLCIPGPEFYFSILILHWSYTQTHFA